MTKPKQSKCECTCHNDSVDFMPIGCDVERICFKCHSPCQPAEKEQTKKYEENLDWEMRYWDLVDELRRQSPKPGSDGPVTVFGYKTCDNGATPVLYTVPDWGNIAKFIKRLLQESEERVRKETLEIIAQGEGWEENGSLGHYRKILNQKDETEK